MSTIDNSQLNNSILGVAAMDSSRGSSRSSGGGGAGSSSWYAAMARAWGNTLDGQAAKIMNMSDQIGAGANEPSNLLQLTTMSHEMSFMANNASTSQNSVGQALETLGKRQ
ncbi:hypothetical protein [Luteimonas huabeiensis]|uniref:hypothetical protein n=1 Tax=Luteimonas huabeiensis TaxID=1244513 RepID=UPI0004657E77|nr:hypothetical protein [Luteimonas huabeiensis]